MIEVRSDSDNPSLQDIWIVGVSLGKIIEGNWKRVESVRDEGPVSVDLDSEVGVKWVRTAHPMAISAPSRSSESP